MTPSVRTFNGILWYGLMLKKRFLLIFYIFCDYYFGSDGTCIRAWYSSVAAPLV